MDCKCKSELIESIKVDFNKKSKKVEKVEFPEGLGAFKKEGKTHLVVISYTIVDVKVDGKKRPEKTKLIHSFCPFCGVKKQPDQA